MSSNCLQVKVQIIIQLRVFLMYFHSWLRYVPLIPSILLVDTKLTPSVSHSTQWASIDDQCHSTEFPEHHSRLGTTITWGSKWTHCWIHNQYHWSWNWWKISTSLNLYQHHHWVTDTLHHLHLYHCCKNQHWNWPLQYSGHCANSGRWYVLLFISVE